MKIFVLVSRIPYPLEKGDKLRAFNQIKRLALHHEIILCCLNDSKVEEKSVTELKKYCKELHIINLPKIGIIYHLMVSFFKNKPFQVGYFYSRYAQLKINTLIAYYQPDRIFCQLIRTSEYVKNIHNIPKTLDYMDVLSKGIERRIKTVNFLAKPIFNLEFNRLLLYERKIFDYFDHKVIISDQDKALIQHPFKDQIIVVPNGVDSDYFKPMEVKKEHDLLFTGNMSYAPNVDSAIFLAEQIIPLVKKKYPGIRLVIAGHNPAPAVKALESENVHVSGWVEDLRLCYAAARIFIAPMNIGTGLQNKLLEAMSMGIPCITSELANNALKAPPGESILIGSRPEEYVQHIFTLLENKEKAQQIAEHGHHFVLNNFNWDATCRELENIICS